MRYQKSADLFEKAKSFIPGGVNSPVRAFKSVGGTPLFIRSAKGAYLYDEDGNQYIDCINSWGPMILGHAWNPGLKAIAEQMQHSISYGAPTHIEIEVAELIQKMVPNVDRVRMVNSGTEACMSAIRLARGYTGKDKIIKFAGCYHGHGDSFLIKAGSGVMTLGLPNSPGVTKGTAQDTLIANYNDMDSVEQLLQENKDEIAAIIIEPVPGNMGCIPPKEGFLKALREKCNEHGVVLIFDEVMTGFRLSESGAQGVYEVYADLITFGKVIGGGMPVGAFGGKKEIMDCVAPVGKVYQAGTLSGNPVAMASGLAVLKYLHENPEIYQRLSEKTALIEAGIHDAFKKKDFLYSINRLGSMISVHFTPNKVMNFDDAAAAENDRYSKFFHHFLENGIYLPPSAFETWFISDALSNADIEKIIDAAKSFEG